MRVPRLVVVLSLACALAAACGTSSTPTPAAALGPAEPLSALAPGDPLEAVVLPGLGDTGPGIDMGNLGGPAVVNFWATWCVFCVDEMPDFERVHLVLGDRVRVVGVDREDNAEQAAAFADEIGVTYELVEDVDGSFFRAAKGRGMPTTLFVDAEGVIRWRHAGPLTESELLELVATHLGVGDA